MITVAERIHIPYQPSIVWSILSDPEQVVTCVEGSRIGDTHEDGSFDAFLAVRFAGIKISFKALVNLTLDHDALTGRVEGSGGDNRGSTRVQGHADFVVIPDAEGSIVTLDGGADVKGTLASLVSTGASLVVKRMAKSFTASLSAKCAEFASVTEGTDATVERAEGGDGR